MTESTNAQATIVRTSRGLSIAGTRITLYQVMDYVKAGWPSELIQHWLDLSEKQITVLSLDSVYEYERALSENAHGTLLMHNTRSASGENHGVHHQLLSEPPMYALW